MKEKQKTKKSKEQQPESSTANQQDDKIWQDPRFSHLVSDPRFKNLHKSTRKVKIDKRFESMFSDAKFKVKYTVDKYGRRVNKSTTEDLKKYYDISEEEDEAAERQKEEAEIAKDEENEKVKALLDDNDQLESDEEIPTTLKEKLKDLTVDYARGEGTLLSDSSSDDESSDEGENDELFIEHVWGELDAQAERTDESTRRLAACNMDWDRIRAADIMVLCNSFLPTGGIITSVTIYPSEFGKERMAEEEVKGPQELTENKLEPSDIEDDDDGGAREDENEEGSDYNMEKLRQYQLNRLKYYYAVIECNTVSAADRLYKECDGLEYESTATKLDLRFIPDDMEFEDEPKERCTELPDLTKYMPRLFTTTALQQAKVELTWDENDLDRKEMNDKLMSGKLQEVGDQELRKYVAYSSEEDEEVDVEEKPAKLKKKLKKENSDDEEEEEAAKDPISKYKDLLLDINKKEEAKKNNQIEMEFSWGIGVKEKSEKIPKPAPAAAELTQFEKILELKKEKKRARKEERKRLRKKYKNGGTGDDDETQSSEDDLPDGIDLNDPYFAEEFASGEFSEAKKSKKKTKGKERKDSGGDSAEEQKEAELALLLDDGEPDTKGHFSLRKIQDNENESKTKKKRKNKLKRSRSAVQKEKELFEDDFTINTKDERFAAVYSSHLFNIDPTDGNFKKTKGMELLISEKLKRRGDELNDEDTRASNLTSKKPKKDVATALLVKSLKRNIQGQH